MKRILFVFVLALITLTASAQKGDQSVGLNASYGFNLTGFFLGVDYRYNITDSWRLAPSVMIPITDDDHIPFFIDMNVHYVFPISETVGLYPLAGLSYNNFSGVDFANFGANFGVGAEIYATKHITVGLELKYNIDVPVAAVRVAYCF